MTRDYPLDPEVAADLALRDRTERDTTRTRGDGTYDWRPPAILESWPCRGCGELVGMPAEAIDAARTCNRKLVAAGDKPLSKRELAVCEPCRARERIAERERDQRRAEIVAALTRELRRGVLPWREAAITDELREMGVDGAALIKRLANETKQAAPTTGARRKSL